MPHYLPRGSVRQVSARLVRLVDRLHRENSNLSLSTRRVGDKNSLDGVEDSTRAGIKIDPGRKIPHGALCPIRKRFGLTGSRRVVGVPDLAGTWPTCEMYGVREAHVAEYS